jgi:hypothetical protein
MLMRSWLVDGDARAPDNVSWVVRTFVADRARARIGLDKKPLRPPIVAAATTISVILMTSLTVSQFILSRACPSGWGLWREPERSAGPFVAGVSVLLVRTRPG